MARQILFGADVTAATATGIIAYKKDANGEPTALLATDDLSTAPEIQFCRNGSGECSPWIMGKDLISWSGTSGVAQTAQTVTVTTTVAPTAATRMTLKLIDKASGSEPFVRESIEWVGDSAGVNQNATALGAAITAHIGAVGYKGMIATVGVAGAVVTITTHTYAGPTALGYNKQSNVEAAFDANGDATCAVTFAGAAATSTIGDPYILADFEADLVGERSGDYYRLQQPNNLTYYAPAASGNVAHDVYALEWGSRYKQGQINKVDNTHVLYIAVAHAAAGAGSAPGTWVQNGAGSFETIMDGYLAHTPATGIGTAL